MPQFAKALAARGRGERVRAERQRAERRDIAEAMDFRAGIAASLKEIRYLLEQEGVVSVVVDIDEAHLLLFNEALYSHELAGYEIRQDLCKANRFKISNKVLF